MIEFLRLRGVCRDYNVGGVLSGNQTLQALRGIDLEIHKGETLGLVGESGSGKSTLAKIILGNEPPSAGQVLVGGAPLETRGRKERARLIQPVFQDPYSSLNPRMSISAIIAAPLEVQGYDTGKVRREKVREMAAMVGLPEHLLAAYPVQLSGGQRQRVAIARGLIVEPEMLICDEPTSALDASVQAQILNLLARLKSEMGLTMLLISHDLGVVRHLSDRVAVLYLGRIVEAGAAEQLLGSPRHPYTETLVGAALPARAGTKLPPPGPNAELPSPLAPPPGCAFHPRCSKADRTDCRERVPEPTVQDGNLVCCHHPNPSDLVARAVQPRTTFQFTEQ